MERCPVRDVVPEPGRRIGLAEEEEGTKDGPRGIAFVPRSHRGLELELVIGEEEAERSLGLAQERQGKARRCWKRRWLQSRTTLVVVVLRGTEGHMKLAVVVRGAKSQGRPTAARSSRVRLSEVARLGGGELRRGAGAGVGRTIFRER